MTRKEPRPPRDFPEPPVDDPPDEPIPMDPPGASLPRLDRRIIGAVEFTADREKGPTVTLTKAQVAYMLDRLRMYDARLSSGGEDTPA